MASAKAAAAAESKNKKKKPPAKAASKPKIKEEITIPSSDESDFDDEDPDSVEVPGGGKDLKTISKIGSAADLAGSSQMMSTPASSAVKQQPGYEVIQVAPGASPFGLGTGIKQQTASVMQQALNMGMSAKSNGNGGPVRMNVPLSQVQAMLKAGGIQVGFKANVFIPLLFPVS